MGETPNEAKEKENGGEKETRDTQYAPYSYRKLMNGVTSIFLVRHTGH